MTVSQPLDEVRAQYEGAALIRPATPAKEALSG